MKFIKNGIIFYSLGNFIFYGAEKEECKKSYCVSIELNEGIKWKVIPVIYKNGQVNFSNDENDLHKIEELSKKIISEEYMEKVNDFCIQRYNDVYKQYYLECFNINRNSFANKIKSCIKLMLNLRKDNEIMLYHNLTIETHIWVCRRALKLIIGKETNKTC